MFAQFKSTIAVSVLLISSLVLSGCGFKLRGAFDIPAELQQLELHVQDQRSELAPQLKRLLKLNDVQLVAGSPYRLVILEENYKRRSVTLGSDAKTDEYELRAEIKFQVVTGQGESERILLGPRTLRTERAYSYDDNNASAQDGQESLLKREIYGDLARQIVRQYISIKPGA